MVAPQEHHRRQPQFHSLTDLPHSQEAEEMLLSICLLDGNETVFQCLRAGMDGQEFYDPRNREIFDRITQLLNKYGAVDVVSLAEDLKADGRLEAVGNFAHLSEISRQAPTSLLAKFYIDRVKKLHSQRLVLNASNRLNEAIRANDADDLKEAQSQLSELLASDSSELPAVITFAELVGPEARPLPEELVKGILHAGGKMMISGGSKSFKTWSLMDLGLSVATGKPWLGFETKPGRVLYLNLELMVEFFEQRIRAICAAKGIQESPLFDSWHLRGYARDFSELMPKILRFIAGRSYKLIILDPVYKILGDRDENANGQVAQLLNEFETLARKTGAAVVYGHHHSKGSQGEKDARDRSSGAGAWARDPDTLIDLTPHELDDHFTATFTLRNNPPCPAKVVCWTYPIMSIAQGLNPADLRKPGRPAEHGVDDIVRLLIDEPAGLTYGEFRKRAASAKISETTFKRLLERAVQNMAVVKENNKYSAARPTEND